MQNQKGFILPIVIAAVVAALLGAGGFYAYKYYSAPAQPAQNQPIVGGDRDAHGCIGSAGYSWCEVKQKCLRTWEEPCQADTTADWKTYTNSTYNYQISYVSIATIEETAGSGIKIKYQNGSIMICSTSVGACGNVPGIVGGQPVNREVNIDGKKYSINGYVYNGNESLYLSLPNNLFVYLGVPGQNIQIENRLLEILSTFKFTK